MKKIWILVVAIALSVSIFAQNDRSTLKEVFKNDDLTISLIDKGTWVVETADRTTMYILEGKKRAMLIDTGTKCEALDDVVRKITKKPFDVVLTHNHNDHAGNIHYFDEVYMHPGDSLIPLATPYNGKFIWLNNGDRFDLGERIVEVYHLPGHTPGSIVLVDRSINAAFTGDTFGSGLVWMQLRPHCPMTMYYESCIRMEKLMKDLNLTKLYVGHYPHVNRTLDMKYILGMKDLAKRLSEGDTAGAIDQPTPYVLACDKPMALKNSETMIVFDSENINDKKEVLILLAHPDIATSKANAAMIEALQDFWFIRVINLYETPFDADTYTEAFREAKHIIFQFPFYWASAPHLLKKWCDEIFGSLISNPGVKGKTLTVATTTGSEYEAYRSGGRNMYTVDELLRPYQVLANHTGMIWQTPFVLYGASLPDAEKRINAGAAAYKGLIYGLIH
jgi:glyoxylase-like metal-dependent hydrolase (beta-lactamase superfamily II)/putative NADPH-quinone reductase